MHNPNSNLPHESYTSDYLDSIKARFPEFSQLTRQELIENLEVNKDRKPGEYEFILKDALEAIDGEVLLNYPDESLFTYLFEELPQATSDMIRKLMTYVMKEKWSGDIVLWSWTAPRTTDFDTKIGWDVLADNYHFLSEGAEHFDISRWLQKQFLVVLRVAKSHEQDLYWRQHFKIKTELIEIPDQATFSPDWMLYKKDLNVAEFKESFVKCNKSNDQN